MQLDDLTNTSGEWLRGEGPEADIVISSRVRLARNLADFPFINRATPQDLARIEKILHERVGRVAAENEEKLAPAIPRVWRSEIDDLRMDLRGWIERAAAADDGWLTDKCLMPAKSVRLLTRYIGGGFGGKGSFYEDLVLAALAHVLEYELAVVPQPFVPADQHVVSRRTAR